MINYELLFRWTFAVDILLCASIVVFNCFLLLSIVFSKRARSRTRNAMLVSVCVADLLVGGFTHPIYIHSYHTGTLFHSCEMHILMQLIGDYSQDFVCYWTMVTLGAVYLYRLSGERWGWRWAWSSPRVMQYGRLTPTRSTCDTVLRVAKKALLVGWPWLGTLLIPIPILMANVDQKTIDKFWDETFCPLHTPFPSRMLVLVLVFYLPTAILLLLCIGLGQVVYWDFMHGSSASSSRARPRVSSTSEAFVQERAAAAAAGGGGGLLLRRDREAESGTTAADGGERREREGEAGEDRANGHPPGSPVYSSGGEAKSTGEAGETRAFESGAPSHSTTNASSGRDVASTALLQSRTGGDSSTTTASAPTATINTTDIDPSVILVGGGGGGGEGGWGGREVYNNGPTHPPSHPHHHPPNNANNNNGCSGSPLERAQHMLAPFLVTVLCALPLMIGWWFYEDMERDVGIIVSVTLSRVYLLRAAVLPVAWFALPELRRAAGELWDRILGGRSGGGGIGGGGGRRSGPRGEMGEFSVAYATLRESRDAPGAGWEGGMMGSAPSGDVARQNPFDSDVRV